jgi:hypothetical protein
MTEERTDNGYELSPGAAFTSPLDKGREKPAENFDESNLCYNWLTETTQQFPFRFA